MTVAVELSNRLVLTRLIKGLSAPAFLCRLNPLPSLVWSQHRQPMFVSEPDAIALAPIFKFRIRELYLKPIEAIRVCALNEVNKKKLRVDFRVIELGRSHDLAYTELLALAGQKNLPDFRRLHKGVLSTIDRQMVDGKT